MRWSRRIKRRCELPSANPGNRGKKNALKMRTQCVRVTHARCNFIVHTPPGPGFYFARKAYRDTQCARYRTIFVPMGNLIPQDERSAPRLNFTSTGSSGRQDRNSFRSFEMNSPFIVHRMKRINSCEARNARSSVALRHSLARNDN